MTTMRIYNVRDDIRTVAERWRAVFGDYFDTEKDTNWARFSNHGKTSKQIYEELRKLDVETCTPADVAAIVGNDTWVRADCSCCGANVTAILLVARFDYTASFSICHGCFSAGSVLWDKALEAGVMTPVA